MYASDDESLAEKAEHNVVHKSHDHSRDDLDAVEPVDDCGEDEIREKRPPPAPLELKRTISNTLERVLTTRSYVDPGPAPDGGLKAWTQVACGWLVILTTWGLVNSYGAFQTYYTITLGIPPSTISWIGTIQNWLTFFVGAFSGRLLDAGFFVPTFAVGAVIQVFGIFMMSLATKYWQLMLTQGLLTGLGNGLFFTPTLGLVATWFEKRRSFALGLATTGNAVGGIVYPLIVRELLPKIGFAWCARVLGFLNLALLLIVFCFIRPRLPPRPSGPIIDLTAFKEPPFVFYVCGMFLVFWAVYYTFYYVASFGVQIVGLEYTASTILIIIINGVGVPARIIAPYFADKVGQLNIFTPAVFGIAIVSYTWLAVSSVSGLYVFTVFYGILSACFQSLIPSTVASITPDMRMIGTRLGLSACFYSFAALTGPPIGGALQKAMGGSFTGATIWCSTSLLIASVLMVCTRVAKGGWKLTAKC